MAETISSIFSQPVLDLIPQTPGDRPGVDYSEIDFTLLGLRRIQSLHPSGRAFLQSARQQARIETSLRAYFGAAKARANPPFSLNSCAAARGRSWR